MEKLSYKHYGLTVYRKNDGTEWAIGSEEKCQRAAVRATLDDLWAFRTEYLVAFLVSNRKSFAHLGRHQVTRAAFTKALEKMQEKLCEDAQPVIRALLGPKTKAFVEHAIKADGRGRRPRPLPGQL